MNLLIILSYFVPIIMISCVLLIIFSFSIQKNKIQKLLFFTGFSIVTVFMSIFMGIIIPYTFLKSIFENSSGILLMLAVMLSVWLIVSIVIKLKNHMIILNNNEKEIYIRDITVKYSPAVLSYLMNNKIETKKDLPATLLNLCINKVLKIEKKENNKINIIDLNNEKEVEKLTPDEKYAYEMFKSNVTPAKILIWKSTVENEYKKYKFSTTHKISLSQYLIYLYMILFLSIFAFSLITKNNTINEIFVYILFSTFFAAWTLSVFTGIKQSINLFMDLFINQEENKNKNNTKNTNSTYFENLRYLEHPNDKKTNKIKNMKNNFIDTYTKKGAIEFNRWKKFEKFIEDFTLVKDKNYESIEILGKYLSYSIALGINKKCDIELYKKINMTYTFNYNELQNLFENQN